MPQIMTQVRSLSEIVLVSLTTALSSFMSYLPALIGAMLILILGWRVSFWTSRMIEKGLRSMGLEKAVTMSGFGDFLVKMGPHWTACEMMAEASKWLIRLLFVHAAANLLQMPQITIIINSVVLYMPNVLVAMVILMLGSVAAKVLCRATEASVADWSVGNPAIFGKLVQYGILGLSCSAALNQLDIAPFIVNTLFICVVGSVSMAVALAFGLGGRDVAAEMTRHWYESGKRAMNSPPKNEPPLRMVKK